MRKGERDRERLRERERNRQRKARENKIIVNRIKIKGSKLSIFRIFEESKLCPFVHFLTGVIYARLRLIVKAIIMNFLED